MKILAHTCLIGTTGYANHARSFFTTLNKYHQVKVRNLTIGNGWKGYNLYAHNDEPYMTEEIKDILYQQTLYNKDGSRTDHPLYNYDGKFKPDVHIVLMETDHQYFYDNYDGYKIAYNVWETTRYSEQFFNRLLDFNEVWVPSHWQYDCLVEQGYPKDRIFVVPEGVDIETFKPINEIPKKDKFKFLLFGRWDYRKSTTEILKTFTETFKGMEDSVEMVCSIENPYPYDGLNSTEERLKKYSIDPTMLKIVNFPSRDEYIKYLQEGDVFVSCSRSEGWNLPLIESMSCGTPSLYSNWGGQLEFTRGKGIPVKIKGLKPANVERKEFVGDYCDPDFEDLSKQMMLVYKDYENVKFVALHEAQLIHESFSWDRVTKIACERLEEIIKPFVFVTTGNLGYMPIIEKLVKSINEFSKSKIIVYGVDCDVPFDSPNLIKRRINPKPHSQYDKWYWKQHACIESLKEDFNNFIWIDGDVVVNYNIDNINQYFSMVTDYPVPDVHVQNEFFGVYDGDKTQLFNAELAKELEVDKFNPYSHICMYVYNKNCKWWFKRIIKLYEGTPIEDYKRLFLWNDEGIDNGLRWVNNFRKFLPLSNFDTSSYDGERGNTNKTLEQFYTFWKEDGYKNFGQIYGYQYIPEDKSKILYFHGNKDCEVADEMIDYIKIQRDNSFYKSTHFYTEENRIKNLGSVSDYEGSTLDVAGKFGWDYAIFHEIYNLREYYLNRERKIFDGNIVVDLGGNIGIFNRWAYSQGASKVISFEPDKRYFKLLSLNAGPSSILFNAAIGNKIGEIELYESEHLGGSSVHEFYDYIRKYKTRTYTLDYLFETGLIDRIDFLKIDIEGAEIDALDGISDENLSKVKTIAMEYHHVHLGFDDDLRSKFINRLNRLGFNSYLMFLGVDNHLQLIYFTK